jgi:hypothetical protein
VNIPRTQWVIPSFLSTVLESLCQKQINPVLLTKLPKLASAFQGSVKTDLSPQQVNPLTCPLPTTILSP